MNTQHKPQFLTPSQEKIIDDLVKQVSEQFVGISTDQIYNNLRSALSCKGPRIYRRHFGAAVEFLYGHLIDDDTTSNQHYYMLVKDYGVVEDERTSNQHFNNAAEALARINKLLDTADKQARQHSEYVNHLILLKETIDKICTM